MIQIPHVLVTQRLILSRHLCALIALSGLLVACGGGEGSDATPEPARSAVASTVRPTATPLSGPAVLGAVVWTESVDPVTKAPLEPVTSFPTSVESITAVLPITMLPEGVSVSATWEYNNTSLDAFGQTIVADRDYTDGWIEFRLAKGDLETWPDGSYEIAVTSDDQPVQTSQVEVR